MIKYQQAPNFLDVNFMFSKKAFLSLASAMIMTFSLYGQSATQKKSPMILYVFSGSDWCTSCIKLERKVLSDSLFLEKLVQHDLKLEKIDFPQRIKLSTEVKKYNESIAEKFGFNGVFPTLILFSSVSGKHKLITYENEPPIAFSQRVIAEAANWHE
jgi:thiol-disulfide isomerase/thioredoxin